MDRKLSLRKTTIRNLTGAELSLASGGLITITAVCPGGPQPPPTLRGSACPETLVTLGDFCRGDL